MSRREFRQVGFSPHIIQIAGFDGREYTVTGTVSVDLVTIPVSITPKDGVFLTAQIRKTAGAANQGNLGLKINGVTLYTATNASLPPFSTTDQAENGTLSWGYSGQTSSVNTAFGIFRAPNYTYPGSLVMGWARTAFTATTAPGSTARRPIATLTTGVISSVTLTGRSIAAGITIGVKNVTVYRVTPPY